MSLLTPPDEARLIEYEQSYTEVCNNIGLGLPAFGALDPTNIVDVQSWLRDMCRNFPSGQWPKDSDYSHQVPFTSLARIAIPPIEMQIQITTENESEPAVDPEGAIPQVMPNREERRDINTSTTIQQASSSSSPGAIGSRKQLGTCEHGCLEP